MTRFISRQNGFSLLEALVAVGILGFVGVGVMTALDTNSRATGNLDEQVTATNLATAHIEAIRNLPYATDYPNAGDNITMPSEYSVVIDTGCSSDGTNFSECTGSENETFQQIIVHVFRDEKPILQLCTYRTKR